MLNRNIWKSVSMLKRVLDAALCLLVGFLLIDWAGNYSAVLLAVVSFLEGVVISKILISASAASKLQRYKTENIELKDRLCRAWASYAALARKITAIKTQEAENAKI